MSAETDLAYIAGYFDGDGSFNTPLVKQRGGMGIGHVVRAAAVFSTTDLTTLSWIEHTLVSQGIDARPSKQSRFTTNGNPYGIVQVCKLADVLSFCKMVGPYMQAKREQAMLLEHELLPLLIGKSRRRWTVEQLHRAVEIKERIDALKQRASIRERYGSRLQDDGSLRPFPHGRRWAVAV